MPAAQKAGEEAQAVMQDDARPEASRRVARDVPARAAIAAGALWILFWNLGGLDLWAPDEPRYARIAEELRRMEHGPDDLVLLRLSGEPYTQKPPLYYWLAAAAGAPAGRVDETAARLPSALAGLAVLALTTSLGGRLFRDPRVGLWSAAVLLTVYRFGHLARRAQLDVLLTALETAAVLALWRTDREPRHARRWAAAAHACLGLAVLTKGPVGLLPLAVYAAALAWEGRLRDVRRGVPPWCLALSLGPALVWLGAAVAIAPPGFFDEAVVENVWSRFASGTSHVRPFYYYLYQLPLDFLPWTLLAPLVVREARAGMRAGGEESSAWRWLLAWVGVFVVFFSVSAGKRGLYLLPAFPALALACGRALERALARRETWPAGLRRAGLVAAGAVAVAGLALALRGELPIPRAPGFDLPGAFGAAIAAVVVAAVAWARFAPRPARPATRHTIATVAAIWGLECAVFVGAFPALDPQKSPRPLAEIAAGASPDGAAIGVFDHRSAVGGLAYYADRTTVPLADAAAVRRFWDSGGGAVVVRSDKLDRLEPALPWRIVGGAREGDRETVVVVPAPPAPDAPRTPDPPHVSGDVGSLPHRLSAAGPVG